MQRKRRATSPTSTHATPALGLPCTAAIDLRLGLDPHGRHHGGGRGVRVGPVESGRAERRRVGQPRAMRGLHYAEHQSLRRVEAACTRVGGDCKALRCGCVLEYGRGSCWLRTAGIAVCVSGTSVTGLNSQGTAVKG